MTPPAARGRCRGGSIACSDCGDHIYQCAKFGACFQKCTNIAYLGAKPLDYSQSSCFSDTISVMVYNCLRHILCFRAITRAKSSMMELTSIVRSNSLSILINISMFRRPCPFVDRWALFIRRSFENERSPVQFVTIIQRYTRSNISTFGKHDCMVFSRISLYMCATASRW